MILLFVGDELLNEVVSLDFGTSSEFLRNKTVRGVLKNTGNHYFDGPGAGVRSIGVILLFPEGSRVSTCLFAATSTVAVPLGFGGSTISGFAGFGGSSFSALLSLLFVSLTSSMLCNNSGFSTI